MCAIKAILFDMDGVLIDAREWHYEALNKALEQFGFIISREEHLTTFDGLPTKVKLEMLSAQKNLPLELHDSINEMKQQYTLEIADQKCAPVFIHEEALSTLKTLNYKIAVCSNSIRNSINVMLSKAHLLTYIDYIVSNEDVAHAKPAPDIYQKAIAYFGLQPNECLIVEDNVNGIKAAQAAQAHLLVVDSVLDTNLDNIVKKIKEIDSVV